MHCKASSFPQDSSWDTSWDDSCNQHSDNERMLLYFNTKSKGMSFQKYMGKDRKQWGHSTPYMCKSETWLKSFGSGFLYSDCNPSNSKNRGLFFEAIFARCYSQITVDFFIVNVFSALSIALVISGIKTSDSSKYKIFSSKCFKTRSFYILKTFYYLYSCFCYSRSCEKCDFYWQLNLSPCNRNSCPVSWTKEAWI